MIDSLEKQFSCVIAIDFVGFGLSDKPGWLREWSDWLTMPRRGQSGWIFMHADTLLEVLDKKGIKGGHFYAHDMGDTILTEIVSQQVRGEIPNNFIQSLTFTNGNMYTPLAKLRLGQQILLNPILGPICKYLTFYKFFEKSIKTLGGPSGCVLSDETIQEMYELYTYQKGHLIADRSIQYYNDRVKFENSRWLADLSEIKVPVHILWGVEDDVAPITVPKHLKNNVCKNAILTFIEGAGHFPEQEKPQEVIKKALEFWKVHR